MRDYWGETTFVWLGWGEEVTFKELCEIGRTDGILI